ncbi:MAG TPA: STAS domain-containing protein [Kineosporiaceae bacterium]|nr:STAS domain-containing protein [Kineosporiaceae bacterium]
MTEMQMLRPIGDIDVASVDAITAEWLALVDRDRPASVVVDFSDVTFVDSSGLSALIQLRNRVTAYGGRVLLRGASWQFRKVLQVTALDLIFPDAHLPAGGDGPDTWDGRTAPTGVIAP